ncbi:hypothetical protein JCM10207_000956 [Rhodosporidiobolus poonsookiae]
MSCLATPLRFLRLSPRELNLATVCASGQSFRWHRSALTATKADVTGSTNAFPAPRDDAEEWAYGWNDRTVVLRQDEQGLYYRSLYPYAPPHTAFLADLEKDTTLAFIRRYFQLDTPLLPLYAQWSAQDAKFKRKLETSGDVLQGIRVLKQDEWETVVSFICSANNNISRITLMVNRLCASRGAPLPHPSHFDPSCVHHSASTVPSSPSAPSAAPNDLAFFAFPPPTALTASSTEPLLRQLGFGYRASFIPSTANTILSASSVAGQTPHEYLQALNRDAFVKAGKGGIAEAREKLLEFKGVGRKVADCILLFSLGWAETVPVDTHVFQIAIRDYAFPATRSTALSPALHDRVAQHLASRWGAHAGWCQQVLFFSKISEGASPKKGGAGARVEVFSRIEVEVKEENGGEEGEGETKRKLTFEEEVAALIANPGAKRSRRSVVAAQVSSQVKLEVEADGQDGGMDSDSSLSSVESVPAKKRRGGAKKGRKAKGDGDE